MSIETQHKGLEELLAVIYGPGTRLDTLLRELGFEQAQVDALHGAALEWVMQEAVNLVRQRLTGPAGQDTWFQMLSRRYGLDGEPAQSAEGIAAAHGMEREAFSQVWSEILSRCRTKRMQDDLKRAVRQAAVTRLAESGSKPAREAVAAKLERLGNLRGAADVARLDYDTKREAILSKVRAELDALEMEFQPVFDSVEENIQELENEIKTDVLMHGESISAGGYRAVYTRGRFTWDNAGIEKYAQKHPEVLEYRKQSAPTVTLRAVGEKD